MRRWQDGVRVALGATMVAGLVACGGGGGGSAAVPETPQPPAPPAPVQMKLVAGLLQGPGAADGTGATAQFNQPGAVAQDAAGNAYVADTGNHTVRKVTPQGVVTTLAGTAGQAGSADGTGAAARFSSPAAIVVHASGDVFVADTGNHTIRRVTPAGEVTTVAGLAGAEGAVNGSGSAARFQSPRGIAPGPDGSLVVVDQSGAIRRVEPGGAVTTFAGTLGASGFTLDPAQPFLWHPSAVAGDGTGKLWVQAGWFVYRFDAQGRNLGRVTMPDPFPGAVGDPRLRAIAVTPAGDLLMAVSGTHQTFANPNSRSWGAMVQRLRTDGSFEMVAGAEGFPNLGHADGPAADARFYGISAISVGPGGRIVVTETGNQAVREIAADGTVKTLAGGAGVGNADGTGAAARFFEPGHLAAMPDGSLRVADTHNGSVRVVTPAGVVSTLPVNGRTRLGNIVSSVASASDGTFYVNVYHPVPGGTYRIAPGGETTPSAGDEVLAANLRGVYYAAGGAIAGPLPAGGAGVLATGWASAALAVDEAGTIFAADTLLHVVRFSNAGGSQVLAGAVEEAGTVDGSVQAARFDQPRALALDPAGQLYVADATTLRRIDRGGQVRTLLTFPRDPAPWREFGAGVRGGIQGLAWSAGRLYASYRNAIVEIGPLP